MRLRYLAIGGIVHAGMDCGDTVWPNVSMQPMAEEVMPRANQAIGAFATA
jgi:hypothetical protein